MDPWDPQAMIFMGSRPLGMGPIIDVFLFIGNFKLRPQNADG